jgi:protein-S-isoprenylcysteine O-methyltransferase Ste14
LLPAKLDRALRRATRDRTRSRRPKTRHREPAGSWRLTAALLLALGAVALLVHHLAPLSPFPAWIEGAGFVAVLALGGALLRTA